MIRFRVAGRPAPQGSKRHVGGGRMVESSRAVGPWREAVRAETQWQVDCARTCCEHPGTGLCMCDCHDGGWPLMAEPVALTAVFLLPRPKAHYGTGRNAATVKASAPPRPGGRPDVDKLARALLDGLVMGGAMVDDAQVVDLNVSKVWCGPGETPGVVIEIEGAK